VFLNSHLLGEVEATCDRVAFVKQGCVIEELDLRDAPTGLEVELRVGTADPAALEGLGVFGDVEDLDGLGETAVAPRLVRVRLESESALPEIAPWLVARGIALYELRVRRKSLEESFIEIMGEDQTPG
jgi:ABC-2 type transport system ATP-binding protein